MNLLEKLLGRVRPRTPQAGTPPTDGASRSSQIAETIDRALNAAGLTRHGGPGGNVRATIDQSLARAGLARPMQPAPATASPAARERAPAPDARPAAGGAWLARTFRNDAGALDYKLYVPVGPRDTSARAANAPMPLVVMLHGCTQSPDDFAAGTGMNALADVHGFLVAYPAQTARANGSKCWNWFRPGDQAHGRGEPALIAGIVGDVAADHRVDPQRVFVAGLSAGAAMAVILGETYPEVFAGVGAHSGLPFAAAHDMGSAFTAMKTGAASPGVRDATKPVPTIVFHGDADHTVAASNGEAIVRDATAGTTQSSTHAGVSPGGRSYTQEVFDGTAGRTRAEHWTVHGAGHAWSGGSERGTYTDPSGPDASAEMVRFFLQHSGSAQRAT